MASDLSGRYLLWHAMNTVPLVRPDAGRGREKRLTGLLILSATGRGPRFAAGLFGARVAGKRRKFPLRAKRFTKMRLHGGMALAFDDALCQLGEKAPDQWN